MIIINNFNNLGRNTTDNVKYLSCDSNNIMATFIAFQLKSATEAKTQ